MKDTILTILISILCIWIVVLSNSVMNLASKINDNTDQLYLKYQLNEYGSVTHQMSLKEKVHIQDKKISALEEYLNIHYIPGRAVQNGPKYIDYVPEKIVTWSIKED